MIPTPVVGHGLVFCASGRAGPTLAIRPGGRGDATSGETFVLRAGPQFEVLRVNRLEAAVLASPALVDGHFYFRTEGELLAIGR